MTNVMSEPELGLAEKAYLIFNLGEAVFAIDVLKIKEMKSWAKVTRLPKAPNYVCGLLNVRGDIVPIMDLRLRLEMPPKMDDMTTVVILLEVMDKVSQITKSHGVVVDSVSETRQITANNIKPASGAGQQENISHIKGVSEMDGKRVTILDTDILFSIEALA